MLVTFLLVLLVAAVILALLKALFRQEQPRYRDATNFDNDDLSVADRVARGLPIQIVLDGEITWLDRNASGYQQIVAAIHKLGGKYVKH